MPIETHYIPYNVFKSNPRLGSKLWKLPAQEIVKLLPSDKFSREIKTINQVVDYFKKDLVKIEKPESIISKMFKRIHNALPWKKKTGEYINLDDSSTTIICTVPSNIAKAYKEAGIPEDEISALYNNGTFKNLSVEKIIEIAEEIKYLT